MSENWPDVHHGGRVTVHNIAAGEWRGANMANNEPVTDLMAALEAALAAAKADTTRNTEPDPPEPPFTPRQPTSPHRPAPPKQPNHTRESIPRLIGQIVVVLVGLFLIVFLVVGVVEYLNSPDFHAPCDNSDPMANCSP
jgi:hypothetical protein